MAASMVGWDHSIEWSLATFGGKGQGRSGECVVEIDLSKEDDAFYSGHAIDGRVLFPATGYMVKSKSNVTEWQHLILLCSHIICFRPWFGKLSAN